MPSLELDRDTRLALRAQAHHLDPVVLLGANGLTDAVIKEVSRALTAHELIKIRIPTDDREAREEIRDALTERLGAACVQEIGKLIVLFRPSPEKAEAERKKAENIRRMEEIAETKRLATRQGKRPGEHKVRRPAVRRTASK